MAQLSIPDNVYNWLVDFFQERSHRVRYSEEMSALLSINASIIQGSAVGPAAYVVNAAYIVVPAVNICSREVELEHIEKWTAGNNLKINRSKSLEISRRRRTDCSPPPHPITDIRRATSVKIGCWVLQ